MRDFVAIEELAASYHTERELHPRDNRYLRISGIGRCRRETGYRIKWHEEGRPEHPIWTHGLFIFDLGHGMHLQLQQRLSNVGPLKWIDAEPAITEHGHFGWKGNCEIDLIDHELRLAGHCDGLTRPLKRIKTRVAGQEIELIEPCDEEDPEGRRYILDIKTITARERYVEKKSPRTGELLSCEIKPSSFDRLTKPKPEHIGQVSLYSYLTTRPGFKTDRIPGPLATMPDLMMIYVAKDLDPDYYRKYPEEYPDPRGLLNSPYKIFTQPTDEKHVQALLRRAAQIWSYLDKGQLPPRDYQHHPDRPAWNCVDCAFRHACYEKEGFFREDQVVPPPLLKYRLLQIDESKKVLV